MAKKKKPDARLLDAIHEMLAEEVEGVPRVYRVAKAFVSQAEKGSFVHGKEILDRQEGRVAARIANADGKPVKLYIGMPVEGEDAP